MTVPNELPSSITISSTRTGETDDAAVLNIETESAENHKTDTYDGDSRELETRTDDNAAPDGGDDVIPGVHQIGEDAEMETTDDSRTEMEALYATVSMISSRQKSQFPAIIPNGCLVDPGLVMSRVTECAKLLDEDDATNTMLGHATGLADNLTSFVSSVRGVMSHLKVIIYFLKLRLFFVMSSF